MPCVKKSTVCLRVYGKDLDPSEITTLLGVSPTRALTRTENKPGKVGMWQLAASPREPADMDGQIHELLSKVTGDLGVWQRITARYQSDLFFGLFMGERIEAAKISAQSVAALGARGITIGLDIYGVRDNEQNDQPEIRRR